jgi:hypothetical protein
MLVLAVLLVGLWGVVSAATAAGGPAPALLAPVPVIEYAPVTWADEVNPAAVVTVTVRDGVFDEVRLAGPDGVPVAGALGPDRTSWRSTEPLGYPTSYAWSGTASGRDGQAVPLQGSPRWCAPRPCAASSTSATAAPSVSRHPSRSSSTSTSPTAPRSNAAVDQHLGAGRGGVGPAARRERRFAGALRPRDYWPAGTRGHGDREAPRRAPRRGRLRGVGPEHHVVRDGRQVADHPRATGWPPARTASRARGSTW